MSMIFSDPYPWINVEPQNVMPEREPLMVMPHYGAVTTVRGLQDQIHDCLAPLINQMVDPALIKYTIKQRLSRVCPVGFNFDVEETIIDAYGRVGIRVKVNGEYLNEMIFDAASVQVAEAPPPEPQLPALPTFNLTPY